jgi:superfamily II DNA or RNA helicase
LQRISDTPADKQLTLVATGRYIGEGFDESRLDTLFLTMPISWKGTLQQYAGRLHRLFESTNEVQIYDYVDTHVGVLERSIDLLSFGSAEESIMRLESPNIASELMKSVEKPGSASPT